MIELTGDRAIRAADIQEEISDLNRAIELRDDEIGDLEDEIDGLRAEQRRDENRIDQFKAELQRLEAEETDPELAERNDTIRAWWKAIRNPNQMKLPFLEVRPA